MRLVWMNYEGGFSRTYNHAIAGLFHQKYSSNWAHMKALNMLFQMRYGSPVCYEKWLCVSPKCGPHHDEASPTQKHA